MSPSAECGHCHVCRPLEIRKSKDHGGFSIHDGLRWIGWIATAVMGVAAVAMGVSIIF
jgi:hypothetical protein